jgi:N-acetyl-anhydromuramyl-L-alanine amidase AmpD
MSQAAFKAEQALGHGDNATTAQDVTNPGLKEEWGNSNETMKALAWMGKNKVEVGMYQQLHASIATLMSSAN